MFEGMDARVRAGRRIPSNAGHRHCEAVAARKWGRLDLPPDFGAQEAIILRYLEYEYEQATPSPVYR